MRFDPGCKVRSSKCGLSSAVQPNVHKSGHKIAGKIKFCTVVALGPECGTACHPSGALNFEVAPGF
jgi:hypothetical protein